MLNKILGNSSEVNPAEAQSQLNNFLVQNETVEGAYKVFRDMLVFTNKRLILVDIQGVSGKKSEVISVPYHSIKSFSVETAGTFDLDSELKIWLTGAALPISKQFKKGNLILEVQKMLVLHTT